jgi:hypothetical protein
MLAVSTMRSTAVSLQIQNLLTINVMCLNMIPSLPEACVCLPSVPSLNFKQCLTTPKILRIFWGVMLCDPV